MYIGEKLKESKEISQTISGLTRILGLSLLLMTRSGECEISIGFNRSVQIARSSFVNPVPTFF